MFPLFCLIVAVSVTGDFSSIVEEEETSVAVVLTTAASTFTETAADVEEFKPDAPEYIAVIEFDPIGNADVVIVQGYVTYRAPWLLSSDMTLVVERTGLTSEQAITILASGSTQFGITLDWNLGKRWHGLNTLVGKLPHEKVTSTN